MRDSTECAHIQKAGQKIYIVDLDCPAGGWVKGVRICCKRDCERVCNSCDCHSDARITPKNHFYCV